MKRNLMMVGILALTGCTSTSDSAIVRKYKAAGGIDDIKNTRAVAEWLVVHRDLNNGLGDLCKPKLAGSNDKWMGSEEGQVCMAVALALPATGPLFREFDLDHPSTLTSLPTSASGEKGQGTFADEYLKRIGKQQGAAHKEAGKK